jgi:hypothetical protein
MKRVPLFLLAFFLVLTCSDTATQPADDASDEQIWTALGMGVSQDFEAAIEGSTCTFLKCTLCPITAPECHQQCIFTGNCPTRCGGIDGCNPGFEWSERACRCLPDHP